MQASEKIDVLLRRLEKSGAEPRRLDALRCTQRFKRSWVELGEMLVGLRRDKAYEGWGYEDFYQYCNDELHIKKATVDKLTASFSTLKRLAPQVLKWDGVEKEIPSYQAVDYLSRAMGAANRGPAAATDEDTSPAKPPREVLKELRHAVFDEGQSVAELRRRFDPILNPKPRGAEELEVIQKALSTTRRLADLLPEIAGLTERRVTGIEKALGGLRQDLEGLAGPLREKIEAQRQKKKKSSAKKAVSTRGG